MKLAEVGEGFEAVFFVVLGVYLVLMLGLAIRGFLLKKTAHEGGGMEAQMEFHFLAGANFGPVVLFLNMCAQYIGGIVMVAAPNDTRALGFILTMWISGCSWCGGTMNLVIPRVREVMAARKYMSPNDYLTDRYRSVWVTSLGVICSTFQMIMITGLEWKSLESVLTTIITEGDPKTYVWACGIFIFFCEVLGGMSSVALTDAVQAGLLLFAFFTLPLLCAYHWGGYGGVGGVDCQNRKVARTFGTVGPAELSTTLHHALTLNADGGRGFNSPFAGLGCSSYYTNSPSDVTNGYAFRLPVIGQLDSDAVNLPNPFTLVNHTFGSPTFDEPDLKEYCCWSWNTTTNVCDDYGDGGLVGVCPPRGSKYYVIENEALKNVTEEHLALTWNQSHGYHYKNMMATTFGPNGTNGTIYEGLVQLPGQMKQGYTTKTMAATQFGCTGINQPSIWHVKYPFKELCALMFSFSFSWAPFALAPITLHRVMTAKTADSIRGGLGALHMFPLTFFTPMILLGITAAALWPEDSDSAMPLVTFKLAQLSGFGSLVGILALTGCIASFMSTADSIVICGSMLFTIDFYWHTLRRDKATVTEMLVVTKVVSLAMICSGILIATESNLNFIEMLNIGNGILGVLCPVYLGLFFHDLRSFEVFIGMMINIIVVLCFELMRLFPLAKFQPCGQCESDGNPHGGVSRQAPGLPDPFGTGNPDELFLWFLPAFWGLMISVPSTLVLGKMLRWGNINAPQRMFDSIQAYPVSTVLGFDPAQNLPSGVDAKSIPGSGRLDLDFEGKITNKLVSKINEPVTMPQAWPFLAFPFLSVFALPWWGYGGYNILESINIIGGMPEWAFDFMFVNSVGTGCLMVTCFVMWKGQPNEEAVKIKRDKLRRATSSFGGRNKIAPDVLELKSSADEKTVLKNNGSKMASTKSSSSKASSKAKKEAPPIRKFLEAAPGHSDPDTDDEPDARTLPSLRGSVSNA